VEGPFDPRVIGLVADIRGRHHEDGAKTKAENMVDRAGDLGPILADHHGEGTLSQLRPVGPKCGETVVLHLRYLPVWPKTGPVGGDLQSRPDGQGRIEPLPPLRYMPRINTP
jgi:hypothetical protein